MPKQLSKLAYKLEKVDRHWRFYMYAIKLVLQLTNKETLLNARYFWA